jgi:hypothetical protein
MNFETLIRLMKSCNRNARCTIETTPNNNTLLIWTWHGGSYQTEIEPSQVRMNSKIFQRVLRSVKSLQG